MDRGGGPGVLVQEHHLWLNLAEMKDVDKARFLDAPISQAGMFGDTVECFAQQFSAVQQQTEAIQHILPRSDALTTAARPQSARRRGCPPASSRAAPPQAESTPRPARRASRRRAAPPRVPARPQVVQDVDEAALTRATWRCWTLLFLRRRREQRRSFPRSRAGRRILCFFVLFCTHFLKEGAISFSSGLRPASSLSPTTHLASSQESAVRGRSTSPRTSGQSRLGLRTRHLL